jgi:hypothetical protein
MADGAESVRVLCWRPSAGGSSTCIATRLTIAFRHIETLAVQTCGSARKAASPARTSRR